MHKKAATTGLMQIQPPGLPRINCSLEHYSGSSLSSCTKAAGGLPRTGQAILGTPHN